MIIFMLAACAPSQVAPVATPRAPQALPAVPVQTLDGAQTTLAAALDGKVALITLWATWCEGCRDELAPLARLAAQAQPHGANVIALAVGEPVAKVSAFVRRHAIPYPQLLDPRFEFADALGSRRIPTTLVIDRAGRIIYSGGALDENALAALRSALQSETAAR